MKSTRLLSKVLFYVTRLLSVIYFGMSALSLIALTTGWSLKIKDEGKHFQVCFPFTQNPFLLGDNNLPYMIFDFLLPIGLYGLFFLLVSNVFKVFFQPKLFTEYGVKHLKRFYLANLILPISTIILSTFFVETDDAAFVLIVLHAILGVFAFLLAAIFKQGVQLQTEQDLII
jgi:Protein of unknown function (DUF2975)